MHRLFALVTLAATVYHGALAVNDRPIIGILAVPAVQGGCDTVFGRTAFAGEGSCFAQFYAQWIEMAGGRVVPIPYDMPPDQLETTFASLNGMLFTGGGLSLGFETQYFQTALHIYNMTIAANDAGDYVPLWGTCMGFQLLNILTSMDPSVLSVDAFDSWALPLALDLTPNGAKSRIFANAPADIMQWLTTENITVNLHHDGVKPSTFMNNAKLSAFYDMISTNKGRQGNEFVSTMEGKKYPIYGLQWHSERPQFEWTGVLGINHSSHAIKAMQYIGTFFLDEARKNDRSFTQAEEEKAILYNYAPTTGPSSYQEYVFPPGAI